MPFSLKKTGLRYISSMFRSRGKIMKKALTLISLITTALLCAACSSGVAYTPRSSFESELTGRSEPELQVSDILKQPKLYTQTLVRFVGEVEKVDMNLHESNAAARILIKQIPVDFREGYSPTSDTFTKHEPAEGFFQIGVPIRDWEHYSALKNLEVGTTVIAYGYPREILNNVVGLYPTVYFRKLGTSQR